MPPTVFLFPFLVLAFVLVLCPPLLPPSVLPFLLSSHSYPIINRLHVFRSSLSNVHLGGQKGALVEKSTHDSWKEEDNEDEEDQEEPEPERRRTPKRNTPEEGRIKLRILRNWNPSKNKSITTKTATSKTSKQTNRKSKQSKAKQTNYYN